MARQLAFYLDSSACNGCKACAIACKSKNNLPVGVNWRQVHKYGGGGWIQHPNDPTLVLPTNTFSYAISVSCMHCQDAACVDVCPAAAMSKREDGVVLVDPDKCIGCRYCEWACPYGAPQFNGTGGKMTKCDLCQDLLAKGENPACVDACVMRALDFGELSELQARHGMVSAIEPMPSADFTQPAIVVTPHRHAQLPGKGTGHIMVLPEEA